MHTRPCIIALALLSHSLLTSCAHQARSTPSTLTLAMPPTTDLLAKSTWHLTHIDGVPLQLNAAVEAPEDPRYPSMSFDLDQGRITGSSAVNRWSAPIDTAALKQGQFSVGMIVATKMAGSPERMNIETALFNALSKSHRYALSGSPSNTLRLLDSNNSPVLQFIRVQPPQ